MYQELFLRRMRAAPKVLEWAARLLIGALLIGAPAQSQVPLTWVSSDGAHLRDSQGGEIILRGFVTMTWLPRGEMVTYSAADYHRMAALGVNYQSIRLMAGHLGAWPGSTLDPSYLAAVKAMVEHAKAERIYTGFKVTFYDTPEPKSIWNRFWKNQNGEQEAVLNGWRQLWQEFKDEPAVVGYDLLNEPQEDEGNGAPPEEFARQQLIPMERRLVDALRAVDDRHTAFLQALYVKGLKPFAFAPYTNPVERPNTVYAPHFYPNIGSFMSRGDMDTSLYPLIMQRLEAEGRAQHMPLVVGEYGNPWEPAHDGDRGFEQRFQQIEEATAALFDRAQVSSSRPWFLNELDGMKAGDRWFTWGVVVGKNDLNGGLRRFITDVVARPYPRRIAGDLDEFSFDFNSHVFNLRYHPNKAAGLSEVAVSDANFPNGFVAGSGGGATLTVPAAPGTKSLQGGPFSFDPTRRVLLIAPPEGTGGSQTVVITIKPAG
jgi:endoglycosylceramidase